MFLGSTSSRNLSSSCSRRQRLRNAMATARLASAWPMMKRSSSETISRGEKSVMRVGWSWTQMQFSGRRLQERQQGIDKHRGWENLTCSRSGARAPQAYIKRTRAAMGAMSLLDRQYVAAEFRQLQPERRLSFEHAALAGKVFGAATLAGNHQHQLKAVCL